MADSAAVPPPLVEWREPDSTAAALLERPGYTATRYQGNAVILDVRDSTLTVRGDRAAVTRGGAVVVGDTIVYDAGAEAVRVRGDTIVLHDPSRAPDDLVARGRLDYDLTARRGLITGVTTTVDEGGAWYVQGAQVGFVPDPQAVRGTSFYALDGTFTSCDLDPPHYHFRSNRIKVVPGKRIFARPAILYIGRVPVAWLPFLVQSLGAGRRSGLLTPRLGFGVLARPSPSFRRQVENLGYYAALGDYMDAQASLDWRSAAGARDGDPGWLRANAEWRYRWLDRFLAGRLAVSYLTQSDRRTNTSVSWAHDQAFSTSRHLTANVNYVTSTAIQRQTAFHPYQALATIRSAVNYTQTLGPVSLALGGSQRQYPGQPQVDRELPTLALTTKPVAVAPWLVWTPGLTATNSQRLHLDLVGLGLVSPELAAAPGGARTRGSTRASTLALDTPLQLFGLTWRNAVRVDDRLNDFAEPRVVETVRPRPGGGADTVRETRVFARTFLTAVDWETGVSLPGLSRGRWNITPSVQLANVDPSALWVRSEQSGGAFVRQSKRLLYGVSASPTLFAFAPGFWRFARLRHAVTPVVSYGYAPAATVSDAFLTALGRSRRDYLGALAQNRITLGVTTDVEAKLRPRGDSATAEGRENAAKVKLLSLTFDALTYDFERARVTRRTGLVNDTFGYTARSDLLPGLDVGVRYSLFQGSTLSDTARFRPYREHVHASISLGRDVNPLVALERLFGRAVPLAGTAASLPPGPNGAERPAPDAAAASAAGAAPLAGGRDWHATFTFTASRQRPPVGLNVVGADPLARCDGLPPGAARDACALDPLGLPTDPRPFPTTFGGPVYRVPPLTTVQSQVGFALTRNWNAQWLTAYDFRARRFAAHAFTFVRELHDWRAVFGYSQAPNGNAAFNFSIALNARPEVRYDYDRQTYGASPFP